MVQIFRMFYRGSLLYMCQLKPIFLSWKQASDHLLINLFHLAERITAHKPRSICIIGGVFLFLLDGLMTDKVQAKKDLEFCTAELSKYQNLSRSGLTRDEMLAIDGIMIKLKERVKNLRTSLYD